MSKRKALAVQSNNLIESRYILTTGEQKLCLAMISKIKPDDIDFIGLEIKVSELAALLDINLKYAYGEIQKITKKLMGRVIHIPEETGWLLTHWVSSCRYHHKKGTVTFKFDENLKPYLLQLREEFTKVHLDVIAQFQSIYTIRIYKLLKAFAGIGWREISIDELKEILGLKIGQYAAYRDFNKRVIAQAKKEMDSMDENGGYKSDLTFRIETIREGRKITRLKFIIINLEKPKEPAKNSLGKAMKNAVQPAAKPAPVKHPEPPPPPKYWKEFREYAVNKNDVGLIALIDLEEYDIPVLRYEYQEWVRKNLQG